MTTPVTRRRAETRPHHTAVNLMTCGFSVSQPLWRPARLVLARADTRPALQFEGTTVDNAVPGAPPAPPAGSTPPRRRPGAGTLLTLVNGVLAGVGSVYVGTHSVLITVIAGITAILLVAMVLIFPQ